MEHTVYRRLLSAVCAIALAFTAMCPAVAAAPEETTGTPQTLTASEVQEMQQTDAAVTALTDSAAYAGMSEEERQAAALAQLDVLAACGNTYRSDDLYWLEGEAGREDHIAAAYRELGFANPVFVGYQNSLNTPADRAGCAFAQKTLVQQGRRTTIIAAMLRGVGYGAEWVSNLHLGENSWHYGFVTAAEQFFADLQDYLACAKAAAGELGTIKLWLGGYSRGAAVANLLAARINKELPGLARENVFVYTFATPVALGPQDYPDLQQDYDNNHNADGSLKESWGESNIFNIISSGDIVPHLLPEEWGFHRNGNDRFLPSTRNEEELADLNEMGKNDFGPTPLDFSWLAVTKETNGVIFEMEDYFVSRENYHEKYEAALMDMIQCAFIRSEEEVTQNKVLDDGEVIQRLRTLTHLKNMDYWKISRAVWAASTMSRAVLKRVDAENIPIRAQQIVVPILAVGLCYGLESEAVSLIAKYILMFVAMKSAPDNVIRAAFCHHCENYIALMEYYAPFVKERQVNSQGKKIVVERPLIPSLFFMRSSKQQALCLEQKLLGKARLYRQLVDFDPQPIAIPKRQMQMFMMVSSGDQEGLEYFEDGAFNWKKGERVRVIDGRFKGLEGEIKRINGDHRLIVTIEGICAVATTYIPRCFLEKI